MATLQIYQGNSRTIGLAFTADDGVTPVNISGCLIYYTAKRSYTESNADAVINKVVTGDGTIGLTGQAYMTLTTGDTSICVGQYLAGWTFVDLSTAVSTFDSDGLDILPSPRGTS